MLRDLRGEENTWSGSLLQWSPDSFLGTDRLRIVGEESSCQLSCFRWWRSWRGNRTPLSFMVYNLITQLSHWSVVVFNLGRETTRFPIASPHLGHPLALHFCRIPFPHVLQPSLGPGYKIVFSKMNADLLYISSRHQFVKAIFFWKGTNLRRFLWIFFRYLSD